MKFLQALILIYLIGVEAKSKRHGDKVNPSKVGKKQRVGSRSFAGDDVLQAGRSQLSETESGVNHGNIAVGIPKYGHFGLDVEGSPGDGLQDSFEQTGDTIGVNPMTNIESLEQGTGNGQQIRRASSNAGIRETSRSQSSQSGAQYGINGQLASYYKGARNQGVLYRPLIGIASQGQFAQGPAVSGSGLVQAAGYPGLAATGQSGQWGAFIPQDSYQGQYPSVGQPAAYPGGFGITIGQSGQFGVPNGQDVRRAVFQTLLPTYWQPADYYGRALSQVGQLGAQFGQSVQGQYSNGGLPTGYGNARAMIPNGQLMGPSPLVGVQGPYTSFGQPAVTGSSNQRQGGGHGGLISWLKSLFSPGTLGKSNVPLSIPTQSQFKQNPCPIGYMTLPTDGRCLPVNIARPYCTNGQTVGCVGAPSSYQPNGLDPGFYSGAEKEIAYKSGAALPATTHDMSRFISSGFYYPPPQHLNTDPNMLDPTARYYFSMPVQKEP